jgi:hypothetical protein
LDVSRVHGTAKFAIPEKPKPGLRFIILVDRQLRVAAMPDNTMYSKGGEFVSLRPIRFAKPVVHRRLRSLIHPSRNFQPAQIIYENPAF